MKNIIIALIITHFYFLSALGQNYVPVEQSSTIKFRVSHQMIFKSTVNGTLGGLKGKIVFEPKNISASSINVSVEVNTINTGIGLRDHDLNKEKYFNEPKYPVITIKSQSISKAERSDQYVAVAGITIKGVTKIISIPFIAIFKNGTYQFSGKFQINRLDFNVGPDNSIDKNVEVYLSVVAKSTR